MPLGERLAGPRDRRCDRVPTPGELGELAGVGVDRGAARGRARHPARASALALRATLANVDQGRPCRSPSSRPVCCCRRRPRIAVPRPPSWASAKVFCRAGPQRSGRDIRRAPRARPRRPLPGLARQGHLNLLAAALEAGFGSYSQFHRIFTRVSGSRPRDYLARTPPLGVAGRRRSAPAPVGLGGRAARPPAPARAARTRACGPGPGHKTRRRARRRAQESPHVASSVRNRCIVSLSARWLRWLRRHQRDGRWRRHDDRRWDVSARLGRQLRCVRWRALGAADAHVGRKPRAVLDREHHVHERGRLARADARADRHGQAVPRRRDALARHADLRQGREPHPVREGIGRGVVAGADLHALARRRLERARHRGPRPLHRSRADERDGLHRPADDAAGRARR